MSRKRSIPWLEKFGRRLNPFWMFFGTAIGFGLSVVVGRWAGEQNHYIAYQRHHMLIAPDGSFYPSLDSLTALVSRSTSKRQILVIVGGSSVLVGVGQKEQELWTRELQRLLGSDFKVINLAFRSAQWTEMGAVVAEVLSRKFPRLIYVADQVPMAHYVTIPPTYEYLFWQAQASGKLLNFPPRSEKLKEDFFGSDGKLRERMTEGALRGYIDYWTHASDLWNYIGYNYFFTVFNPLAYHKHFFEARKNYVDEMAELPPIPERFKMNEQIMKSLRVFGSNEAEKSPTGELKIRPLVSDAFLSYQQAAFPDVLKPKTLIILTYMAPYYSRQLSGDEYSSYEFVFREGKNWLQKAGYHSVIVGPDLTDEDFADLLHLTASGGRKMASDVVPEIRSMAVQLGYQPGASKDLDR